ncbi:BQ5605_C022g09482 [Microbotryum silenes-dioicae]|uniref:BQ5605_C022g09482 protein n=1 Tax=Microbotryum silenes-dioicae TaxID=796604 RepID=A0A2X0PEJ5_9BASI|nr:BQ5605_C022g09482 [Microbotryum silenes-dioicae]
MVSAPKPPTALQIAVLVAVMLVAGTSNSVFSKWQDMQCVANCDDPARKKVFEQPVWQTATMFLGETLCLVAFKIINSKYNPYNPSRRRVASASARAAASHSQSARLASAPLSRPDESAFNFNESAISLRGDEEEEGIKAAQMAAKQAEENPFAWERAILFWGPACCDICGTTAMNVGLLFVPVSIYQMLRGALVLWVGVLSLLFLGRKMTTSQWSSLATVMAGVAVVGCSSLLDAPKKEVQSTAAEEPAVSPLVGVCLILVAQVFTASQFVLEEKIMERQAVEPLLAAGFEGFFGLSTTITGLLILHVFIGSKPSGQGGYFDAPEGWHQIVSNPSIWSSSIAIAISIALFNFCGLAVTRTLSATSRSTIDTSRTLLIWLVSMSLGWEHFKWLQVIGFGLLVYGTFVFNGITQFPKWTGLRDAPQPITVILPASDDELSDGDDDDDVDDHLSHSNSSLGRSRSVDTSGRPMTKRSGSGRRGEVSPLLKNIDES